MQPYPPQPGYPVGAFPGPPPAPAKRRALPWILTGIAVLCVALLVGGVIWWWQSRDDDGDGPVPGQLTREFPTAPSVDWKVTAADLDADRIIGVTSQEVSYFGQRPAISEDGATVAVLAYRSGGTPRLNLIDVESGRHRELDDGIYSCSERIVDDEIACLTGTGSNGGPSTLITVNVRSGEATTIKRLAGSMVAQNASGIFVHSYDSSARSTTLTRFSRSGAEIYRQTYDAAEGIGSGDSWGMTATDSVVIVNSGGAVTTLRADDGKILSTAPGYGRGTLSDGGAIIAAYSGTQLEEGTWSAIRTLPSGEDQRIRGERVVAPTVVGPRVVAPYFVDDALYLDDESRWKAPADMISRVPLVSDDVTVVTGGKKITGLDTDTGRELWSRASGDDAYAPTDGRRIMHLSDGRISAVDLHTGEEAWQIPAPSDEYREQLRAAGEHMISFASDQIVAYKATGGAAKAPGSHNKPEEDQGSGSDDYFTRCGSKPVFTPEQFRTEVGGLVVKFKVTATCAEGDALTAAGTGITISDAGGVIASGTFDFSTNSVGIPKPGDGDAKAGATVELQFAPGQFFRTPDTLPAATAGGSGGAAGSGHSYLVECDQPAGSGRAKERSPSAGAIASSGAGPQAVSPLSGYNALRLQADSDKSFILSNLNNRWVAQLSSKRVGLVADGRTWDEKAILDEFLALRLRFADARLLYSDEWSVFSYKGWWVTVATVTFPGPDEANAWCRTNGFDRDHCFAKLVSTTAGSDNSTRYW